MRAILAGTMLLLASCTPEQPEGETRPVVRIAGSDAVIESLVRPLAQTHERVVGDYAFELAGGGTQEGFRALLAGEADLVAATRRHLPAEEEQAVANGYSLEDEGARHIAAVDVVAVAVHPSNPIQSLTYDQVIGIFCTRSVDTWAYLGLSDRPIHPLARDPLSGTRVLFEDFFCGPRGLHPTISVVDEEQLRSKLSQDDDAVGFVSMSHAAGKQLGLRPDPQGLPVWPSQQNIIRGAYPLYRDIYLYTAGPASGEALSFIEWIGSPAGQEVVDEARYVPLFLRPERMDEPRPLRETIHFDPGEASPNQRSCARLDLLVQELRDRAVDERHIILEGYTDSQEPEPVELSRQRAEKVRDMLSEELPGMFFEIIPRGPVHPLAPNTTPYGRQRNRRVQVYLADEEAIPRSANVETLQEG